MFAIGPIDTVPLASVSAQNLGKDFAYGSLAIQVDPQSTNCAVQRIAELPSTWIAGEFGSQFGHEQNSLAGKLVIFSKIQLRHEQAFC
jgi:hypothetical protein